MPRMSGQFNKSITVCCRHQMIFLNTTTALIPNYRRHCIEIWDRVANTLLPYCGKCGQGGKVFSGNCEEEVMLRSPYGIAYDEKETVFTSLERDNVILAINVSNLMAMEFTSTSRRPRRLHFYPNLGDLVIALDHGLGVIDTRSNTKMVLVQGAQMNKAEGWSGPLLESSDIRRISGLIRLDEFTWIMADSARRA